MEQVSQFSTALSSGTGRRPHPVLQQYAHLPPLIEPGTRADPASVHRLAELLESFGESADINLQFVGITGTQGWHVTMEPGQAAAREDLVENADLELIMRLDTWTEIASGSLSPLVAFGSGRMRVRGDVGLAKRLLRHLATSPDAVVDIC
jgi:SCP-2 sterol transfer family